MEQYKLEQQDLIKKHFRSGEHLKNFLIIILTLAYNLHTCCFKSEAQLFSLIIIPRYFD